MERIFNRSTITYIVNETLGAMIIVHELIFREGERPFFLALAGTLMGLPFVLSADGRITRRREQEAEGESEEDWRKRWSHLS